MNAHTKEVATLGGGCYWCIEAVFEQLEGVEKVVSGFSGGHVKNPGYREVCEGDTGHAEVVQVTFDPAVISYRELVELFFAFHDPTTMNRQGPDTGTQYRSAIFTHSPEQAATARAVIDELTKENVFGKPIVTQVAPFDAIVVTAAPDHVPRMLLDQLKVGGKLVLPVGRRSQMLQLWTRTPTSFESKNLLPVQFVPMTGEARKEVPKAV
jgi:peptide-methionine (S)-S-oxide reductase